jgi:hypothetical protein
MHDHVLAGSGACCRTCSQSPETAICSEACGPWSLPYLCTATATEEGVAAALSRMGATALSFALCFIYLLFFPFHFWEMATRIGIGAVAMSLLGRPDDVITTGITTAVVMVWAP